jgi:threonylcarbamoyladenosine tRNA methylthiotransferase MtaB
MDVFVASLGCRLNEAEAEAWARSLGAAGHRLVAGPEAAQILVLNSCAVTSEAAKKSRQQVRRLHRANPSARLVVTGCYAELEPEQVASLTGVDLVVGNRDKDSLVDILSRELTAPVMPKLASAPDSSHLFRDGRTRAFIKVQDGCRNRCSFCIVTVARGEERSRPIADVVAEVNQLVRLGYQEAVLTGVHLGGYGSDIGADLTALVRAVLADTDMPRIRLSSLEPWDVPQNVWQLWANPRLMPHLHLPLQSGCDPILKRMARRCGIARYEALVTAARDSIADLTVTTDIIVGFPGEGEAQWATTLATVERIGFAHIHIFTYSAREGTAAARMPGQVDSSVKRRRSRELHKIAAAQKAAHLRRFAGSSRAVLWEGSGGYTDNYLRVESPAPASVDNVVAQTRLVAVAADGTHLIAEPPRLDRPVSAPRSPVRRLPVLA